MIPKDSMKIIHPQEIEAWYVLPLIRKELAMAMKKEGIGQKDIAKLLDVTEAAVSQYVNNKRGNDFQIEDDLKHIFVDASKKIMADNSLIFAEVQGILKILWDKGFVCEVHKKKSWCPEDCGVCF